MSPSLPEFRSGLPAAKVDQSLRRAFAVLDAAHQCALLWFHDAWQRQLYRDLGFASMEQYATEALKFSPNRTWQFLRLARDLDRLPPLLEAVTDGSLEWTKAQQVGRVATPETAADWVAAAKQNSRRKLAQQIKVARTGKQRAHAGQGELPLTTPAETELPPPRVTIGLSFDSLDAARLDAMIEAAKKSGAIAAEATREDALLAALDSLVGEANCPDGDSPDLRRRKSSPPYRVVLYRCRDCQQTEVVAGAGRRPVDHATGAGLRGDSFSGDPSYRAAAARRHPSSRKPGHVVWSLSSVRAYPG